MGLFEIPKARAIIDCKVEAPVSIHHLYSYVEIGLDNLQDWCMIVVGCLFECEVEIFQFVRIEEF